MKNIVVSLACILIASTTLFAANGDTLYVKSFDKYHMGSYGTHLNKTLGPPASRKNQRVWMKYTIGCTANGQCEWDYTVKLILREHLGTFDSTLKQAPSFKLVGGAAKDTVVSYSTDTTYINKYNSVTHQTDSQPAVMMKIALFGDTLHPLVCTDTLRVWPVNYYRYQFDTNGVKTDSVLVPAQFTIQVKYTPYYTVFENLKEWEMGRMISPYAKFFPKTFQHEHLFDVTDFASLLHDSLDLKIQYEGYSFGFTSTLEFYFVEGTPAREAFKLDQLYNAYYLYGNPNNSIENALNMKKFTVPADAVSTKLRILITGHGGESNENCAEFCAKNYYLKLNGKQIASQLVWKDDCGSNAIINQGGTWIYDRANWCPGEKIRVFEYPLDVAPGSTDSIDMDMDPFMANGSAGYSIAAYVVYYKAFQYANDVSLEEIKAPTKNFWYNRINPVCDKGSVLLRNFGSEPLTSCELKYRIGNASERTAYWVGNLKHGEQGEAQLPYLQWPSDLTQNTFTVWVTNVNGKGMAADGNPYNNALSSIADVPLVLPADFIVETTPNLRPEQTSFTIKDEFGKVNISKTFTAAGTLRRDTFHLGTGCYTFELLDAEKNGLSFFANNDGNGQVRIRNALAPIQILKTFNPDFGTFLKVNFSVMYKVGLDENTRSVLDQTQVYPSPANDRLYVETSAPITVLELMSMSGNRVLPTTWTGEPMDISTLPPGMYLLRLEDANGNLAVRKVCISR